VSFNGETFKHGKEKSVSRETENSAHPLSLENGRAYSRKINQNQSVERSTAYW
jgi:hypothetical protein